MASTEIEALENAFRAAQARLGVAAGLVARDEWMGLNLSSPSSGSRSLLMRLLRLILGLRSVSRRLSKSYYRLARAIETGRTLDEGGEDTTLKELREEFDRDLEAVRTLKFDWPDATAEERYAAEEMRHVSKGDTESWNPAELDQSIQDWIDSIVDSDGDVNGEKVKWSEDRVRSLEDAMREFRRYIEDAGVKNLEAKIKEIKRKYADDPDRMLAELDNAFLTVRETLAGNIDKAVIDSGREWLDDVIVKDGRARLVARGVRSNPCHFCSMLASRGFVYASERAAMAGWHVNCHCYPIVRWDSNSPLPERNQYYYDMWPEVTNGYYGKEKVKAWRRWIAKQRKAAGGKL